MTDRRARRASIRPSSARLDTPHAPTSSLPGPFRDLIDDRLDGHPSFVRGLSVGLLVGAAVAGSTIWSRWRSARAGHRGDGTGG